MTDLVWCRGGPDSGRGSASAPGRRGGAPVWSHSHSCASPSVCYSPEPHSDCLLYRKKFEVSNNKSKWEENLSDEVAIEINFCFHSIFTISWLYIMFNLGV